MCEYKNGKIYKLVCEITGEVYIGSTKRSLEDRLSEHLKKYNPCCSKQIINRNKYYIEQLELYPCNNRQELEQKEGEYQRAIECINNNIAGRTYLEWCNDNKEHLKEYRKQYQQDNKEQQRQYRQDNKEVISKNSSTHYQDNKEQIAEYQKQYYIENTEFVKARQTKEVICECGSKCAYMNLARHKKTKKHIDLMSNLNQPSSDPLVAEMPEQNQAGRISNH